MLLNTQETAPKRAQDSFQEKGVGEIAKEKEKETHWRDGGEF